MTLYLAPSFHSRRGPGWLEHSAWFGLVFAHCGVVHRDLGGGEYSVVEALWSSDPVQDGTRFPVRRFDDPQWQYKFVWLPDDGQRVALLDASERLGLERPRYDWPELVRIAARGAGVKWRRPAGERRLICSHHVARCVVEAAPEFEEFCRVRLGLCGRVLWRRRWMRGCGRMTVTDDFVILPRRGRRSYVAQAIVDAGRLPVRRSFHLTWTWQRTTCERRCCCFGCGGAQGVCGLAAFPSEAGGAGGGPGAGGVFLSGSTRHVSVNVTSGRSKYTTAAVRKGVEGGGVVGVCWGG